MSADITQLLRDSYADIFARFPGEQLLGLQFPCKVRTFSTAERELRHFFDDAEKITGMQLFPFGLIVQGIEKTHVHLLVFGIDKDTGETMKSLPKETIEKIQKAWHPKIRSGEEAKRLHTYLKPVACLEAVSSYLADPKNLKLSGDICKPDKFKIFGDWNKKLVTRAATPKSDKERSELKLPPLKELPVHPPCFSFLFTPANKCCFRCGISDRCMKSTRERSSTSMRLYSSPGSGTLPPTLYGEYGLPSLLFPVSEDSKSSLSKKMLLLIPNGPALQAEIHKYRSQPLTPPSRISEAAWKEKIKQAEVNKHSLFFFMNTHRRDDEFCLAYHKLLQKSPGLCLGWKSHLYRVTSWPYKAMKTDHWIHLRRARVWADFFGCRYDDFLEPIFYHYSLGRVKKSLFPAPDKLYGSTALSAYQDYYAEATYPHLRFFINKDNHEFADYLSPELLPENYVGTPVQVAFYERIHADFRRMAAETRREITSVIDSECTAYGSSTFRELMYVREGKEVPPKRPSMPDRFSVRKSAEPPEPPKPLMRKEAAREHKGYVTPESFFKKFEAALKSKTGD